MSTKKQASIKLTDEDFMQINIDQVLVKEYVKSRLKDIREANDVEAAKICCYIANMLGEKDSLTIMKKLFAQQGANKEEMDVLNNVKSIMTSRLSP